MNNADYWKQRFEQLEDAQNALGEKTLGEIEKQYNDTLELLEARILLWYQRLADNNGISLATARAWLGSSELREFRWTVKEYIKYGKENALNQKWVKELENASAKYHISKLEALKIQTRQSLEAMYAKQGKTMQKAFSDIYKSGYYHTAYEIQHGLNIGWDISGIDQQQIEKVLSKPWAADGYNFSERIWKNKNKLISEVHTSLVQNIQLGADPQKAINDIAAKMKTSKRNAGRLVMTEEAYFSSAAQKDCFVSLGVEEYEIVATLDSHTSKICRTLDKKHFPVKDYQAGVTAPPFHVYCRSTTAPYFDDEFDVPGERAARDKDGNTYYIPADMNYREWEKTFVKDSSGSVDKSGGSGIIGVGEDEMYRKKDIYKIEPMPKKQFRRIKKSFEAKGGIIQCNAETDLYLESKNAEAITYNETTILLKQNPGRASVFEELIHTAQYKSGKNDGSYISRLKCEISAQKKLIKNARAYKLTKNEILQTKSALQAYENELNEYIKNGGA